eukprot:COSAG02_NODE_19582_length_874_cov_22.287742_1_plen_260_part_10
MLAAMVVVAMTVRGVSAQSHTCKSWTYDSQGQQTSKGVTCQNGDVKDSEWCGESRSNCDQCSGAWCAAPNSAACTVSGLSPPENGGLGSGCEDQASMASGQSCTLTCDPGYTLSGTQPSCTGGEFRLGDVACEPGACNTGYTAGGGQDGECADVDECTDGSHNCDANAACANTAGSFTCACNSGFTADGTSCTDDDECTDGSHNCDANAACANTAGSFTCACNSGFTADGTSCTDDDECTDGSHNCDANAACANTAGSFT